MNALYNFSGANLPKWSAALANVRAGTARAKMAGIGDSTTMGYGAAGNGYTGARPFSYPSMLTAILDACYVPAQNDSFFGDAHVSETISYSAYDPRVALGAGWSFYEGAPDSLGGKLFDSFTATTPLRFAPAKPVDTFDVYYLQNSTFAIQIDGVTVQTVSNGAGNNAPAKVTVQASTVGTHTLSIVPNGANPTYIVGVDAYSSATKAVAIWNMGMGGAKAADWADVSEPWNPTAALKLAAPDLSLICLGINDWNGGTSVASFLASMAPVIDAARQSGDAIIVAPVPSATTIANVASQHGYIDLLYALADRSNCPLIDLTQAWGSYAEAQPNGFYYDTEHPSGAGYVDVAKTIATAIATIAG